MRQTIQFLRRSMLGIMDASIEKRSDLERLANFFAAFSAIFRASGDHRNVFDVASKSYNDGANVFPCLTETILLHLILKDFELELNIKCRLKSYLCACCSYKGTLF